MSKNKESNFIAGIDPSLSETGVIIYKEEKIIVSKLIKTKKDGDTPASEILRLQSILEQITSLLDSYKPAVVVMEGIAFMARNTTAIVQLCGLNYLIRNDIFKKYKSYIVPPTCLKKFITGKGNIQKDLMMLETYKRYNVSFNNNNLCDAYGLAKIGEAIIKDCKLTSFQDEVVKILQKQYENK